jgi:hypothetical protein
MEFVHHPEFEISRKQRFGNYFRLQAKEGRHLLCYVP